MIHAMRLFKYFSNISVGNIFGVYGKKVCEMEVYGIKVYGMKLYKRRYTE